MPVRIENPYAKLDPLLARMAMIGVSPSPMGFPGMASKAASAALDPSKLSAVQSFRAGATQTQAAIDRILALARQRGLFSPPR